MNRILLIIVLCYSIPTCAQSLSKTDIIYERKDQVVLNTGKSYQIVNEKAFYEVTDISIKRFITVQNDDLMLNRVLVIRGGDEYIEIIEWTKNTLRYYESRNIIKYTNEHDYVSDTN